MSRSLILSRPCPGNGTSPLRLCEVLLGGPEQTGEEQEGGPGITSGSVP